MKFLIDLTLDGYETEEEMGAACREFIYDQLNFAASGVTIFEHKDDALKDYLDRIAHE